MGFYIPLSETWMLSERIMCVYSFIHGIIALIFIFWHNRINNKTTQLMRVILSIVIGYIFQTLIAAFIAFFEFYPHILQCISWYSIEFTSYYVAKFFIWYYAIIRLKIIFQGIKLLKYDSNTLKLITLMFLLTTISLNIFCITCSYVYELIYVSTHGHCTFHAPIWFAAVVGIFDSIMGILCYWLFHRRLSFILAINKANTSNRRLSAAEKQCDYELAYIVRKFAILSGCTLLSTWIAAGFGTFTLAPLGLFGIDTVINTYCILLYDARYDHIYHKLFKCISKSQWKYKKNNNGVRGKVTTKTGNDTDKRISNTAMRTVRIHSETEIETNVDINIEMTSMSHQ
eukprot:480354_1